MADVYELTVLMPCLNEEESLAFCILEAKKTVEAKKINAEILIADNGSTDGSRKIAKKCGARVVTVSKKGYGNALRGGIKASKGTYIVMGDCDGSYDFTQIPELVAKLREGYGLVMGNRFAGGIEKGAMPFSHRYIGIPFLSMVGRIRYKVKITDFHCGLRGFCRADALLMSFSSEGMEFASEIIGKFAENGKKICEIPVRLRKDLRKGRSHLRSVRDGIRHLKIMLAVNGKNVIKM